jgi:hypothetical protein
MMQDWHVRSLLQDWVALDGSNLDEMNLFRRSYPRWCCDGEVEGAIHPILCRFLRVGN